MKAKRLNSKPITPCSDFQPLAELLSNWFDRHKAEWKANGVTEEKITQLKNKVSKSRAGGGDQ